MKRSKKQLQTALIRELIRRELYKTLKEGAGGEPPEEEEEEVDAQPEEPIEEPTEEPEEEEAEEPGLDEELAELTDLYIKKLKDSKSGVDQSDIIEIVSGMLDSFGYGNQDKLTILQGVKEESLR
tara:strand:- start:384 stop:758 length:375 start_codon:yes stop_codon:yes gene_type:complete